MYQATTPCPRCGAQNLKGTWVCVQCGNTLIVYCPYCRAGNEAGSPVCHNCHAALGTAMPPPPAQQPPYPGYEQYPQYPPPSYGQPGMPPQPPYPDYQQPPDPGYDQYQQYPGGYNPYGGYDPYGAYPPPQADWLGKAQMGFDNFKARVKHIVVTTNPILLSSLVVLIVGMAIFLFLAFQFGWIKTAAPATETVTTDTSPVLISALTIEQGSIANSAIISWATDKYSSSQVKYGIWPYANNTTPIENDPRTGVNMGLLTHKVGLTNLLPNTTYVYQAISIDKDGNTGTSPEMQFQTTQ